MTRRVPGSASPYHRLAAASIVTAFTALVVAACSSPASHTPAGHTPNPSTPPPSAATTATPTAMAVTTLAGCAAPVNRTALHVIHHFSVSPDDITVDATGRLWVTAREAGELIGINQAGGAVTTATVTGGPEGVAVTTSGTYVAQQNVNTVEQVTPQHRAVVVLPNPTSNAGIDGISIGASSQTLLVPDSPVGTLLQVSLTGAPNPHVIATHLGRPVAAAAGPAGVIYVASESSPGLVMVTAGGAVSKIGAFSDLDEVVVYAGLLYVTDLTRHDVVAVDPRTGASVALAVNLPAPQGLAVTAQGMLEIVDATTDTLYSLPACGVA